MYLVTGIWGIDLTWHLHYKTRPA